MSNTFSKKRVTGGVNGGIINEGTLDCLDYKRDYLFPFSLLLRNTRPIGFQVILKIVQAGCFYFPVLLVFLLVFVTFD
jgi:hypothetical protein